jgi:hypothetical protein
VQPVNEHPKGETSGQENDGQRKIDTVIFR